MGASQYLARAMLKDIENHELSERRIWHQFISQNSKHSEDAENSVLLDAEKFSWWYWLDHSEWDLNECVRPYGWVHIIKKMKLYDECCDQIFLNMNQIVRATLYFPCMELWKIVVQLQRPSFYLMLPAMLSGVQHWTQKVPELWYFRNFLIHLRNFVIINVIKLFLI